MNAVFLHCNQCYTVGAHNRFHITQCGKVYCNGCVDRSADCDKCRPNQCRTVAVNSALKDDILVCFQDFAHTFKKLANVELFQRSQTQHLLTHLIDSNEKLRLENETLRSANAELTNHFNQIRSCYQKNGFDCKPTVCDSPQMAANCEEFSYERMLNYANDDQTQRFLQFGDSDLKSNNAKKSSVFSTPLSPIESNWKKSECFESGVNHDLYERTSIQSKEAIESHRNSAIVSTRNSFESMSDLSGAQSKRSRISLSSSPNTKKIAVSSKSVERSDIYTLSELDQINQTSIFDDTSRRDQSSHVNALNFDAQMKGAVSSQFSSSKQSKRSKVNLSNNHYSNAEHFNANQNYIRNKSMTGLNHLSQALDQDSARNAMNRLSAKYQHENHMNRSQSSGLMQNSIFANQSINASQSNPGFNKPMINRQDMSRFQNRNQYKTPINQMYFNRRF